LGRIDDDGNLWITGRASDIFKTAKGKFISPMAIESLFLSSPWLEQCCVFGHGLSQPVLVANLSAAGQALEPAQLQAELDKTLVEINSELASHEQVAIIHITPEWTGAAGLLTPTLKIKRKKIEAKFRAEVETALQASAAGVS